MATLTVRRFSMLAIIAVAMAAAVVPLRAVAEDAPAAAAPAQAGAASGASTIGADAAKALWTKQCASCHGESGKADTKVGTALKVRDLTDPAVRAAFDRERMIKGTKEGVKRDDKLVMKGFADKLSDAEIAALIDHVYALGQ